MGFPLNVRPREIGFVLNRRAVRLLLPLLLLPLLLLTVSKGAAAAAAAADPAA
jgi:hypothetical protein